MNIPIDLLVQLGISAAELVTKVIVAIETDKAMTQAEKQAALLRIRGQLLDVDAKVQAVVP